MSNQRNSEYGYALAYKLACERLAQIGDIEQQCRQGDAQYQMIDSKKSIIIKYLNQSYLITLPHVNISLVDSKEEVPLRDKILMLHYLSQAQGTALTNKIITYKELPEGASYFPTFSKRTIKPILAHFGQEPERLVDIAAKLGGYKVDYGDVAVTVNAFSRVSVTLVLWRGDDELVPEGSILFDSNITDYLSTEDVTVLCEIITWRLINYLRKARNPH